MKKILFVPRKKDWIEDPKNADVGVGSPGTLQERMGVEAVLTLDFTGKFNIDKGGYIYVFPGHGTAGSDTVHWVKEGENLLTAKEVAELTAERFPNCTDVSRSMPATAVRAVLTHLPISSLRPSDPSGTRMMLLFMAIEDP